MHHEWSFFQLVFMWYRILSWERNGSKILWKFFNPLSAKPRKWSDTLKQFVGKLPTNCLSAFDHFLGLALKGLIFYLLSIVNQMCLELKERPFIKCGGNKSSDKLVVLAKYSLATVLLFSITYYLHKTVSYIYLLRLRKTQKTLQLPF